ncbi:MAG: hypothetical protein V1875_00920 [Candidatus Altiarchaeota archaeon]
MKCPLCKANLNEKDLYNNVQKIGGINELKKLSTQTQPADEDEVLLKVKAASSFAWVCPKCDSIITISSDSGMGGMPGPDIPTGEISGLNKWEYLHFLGTFPNVEGIRKDRPDYEDNGDTQYLDQLGDEGWELASVVPFTNQGIVLRLGYFLKRKKLPNLDSP